MIEKIQLLDKELLILINSGMASPYLDSGMTFISGPYPWIVGLLLWLGISLYRKAWHNLKAFFVCSILMGIADMSLSYFIKPFFGRLRPCKTYEFIRTIDGCGGFQSFPSNHATNAMIIATFALRFCKPRLGIPIMAFAFAIALSRIYLGVHYPMDVVSGMMIGLFCALLTLLLFKTVIAAKKTAVTTHL